MGPEQVTLSSYKNFHQELKKLDISKSDNVLRHFTELDADFTKNLLQQYPYLTKNDLKHIAYLKLNLSSKEISNIQGVSIRAVQTAHYRLKKKLNLNSEESLVNFIQTL